MSNVPLQTLAPATPVARTPSLQSATQIGSTSSTPPVKQPISHNKVAVLVRYWTKPAAAFLIYALTIYVAATATFRYTLLGRVSAPLGTWILTLLAKGGDIVFAFAVEDVFDTLTWRMLKEAKRVRGQDGFGGIRLEWFLALVSTTHVEGLFRILARSIRRLLPAGEESFREAWMRSVSGRWSFVRLVFIFALIPGPGIILMANVSQRQIIFPVRYMDVSGGLGVYDPRSAEAYHTEMGPQISKLVQSTLRDPSISWPVDPISADCKSNPSCKSYLLAGPYQTVAPWPFTVEAEDVTSFRLYDAPFYQVDLWDPAPSLTFNESRDCTLYGGMNATSDFSMTICIAQQSKQGLLAAGWKSCQLGYASNGTCLMAGSVGGRAGWATYLQFYRRTATVTFSRSEFTIQEVFALSPPKLQEISPESLVRSLNSVLYRPNQSRNDPRYDLKSQQYVLTQTMASSLWYSLYAGLSGTGISRDWLRNLLTMPVYFFQPTVLAFDPQFPLVDNGTAKQPNLPAENYVKGAYCVTDNRSVPSWGTVLAYAIVAGVVLVFVGTGKWVATLWPSIEVSEYSMLDFEVLTVLVDEMGEEVRLRDRFDGPRAAYEEGRLLEDVSDLRIGLRKW